MKTSSAIRAAMAAENDRVRRNNRRYRRNDPIPFPDAANTYAGPTFYDLSPMPFGRHKGTPMRDVPVDYLHYLWTHGLREDYDSAVADYIRSRLSTLKTRLPDASW